LKQITAPYSNDVSAPRDERPLAVRLALALIRGYKILISPYFRGSCRFLPSCADYADEAIARVAQRVKQGGHDIPETVIRRRFDAGIANFKHLYAPCVDAWALYDNAGAEPVLLDWNEKS